MDYNYEYIEHNAGLPFRIFTHTVEQFPYHWHEDLEVLFILKGALDITINKQSHVLNTGDVFLINQNEIHFVRSLTSFGRTQLLALQFDVAHFRKFNIDTGNQRFRLNSSESAAEKEQAFARLRYLLATMMETVVRRSKPYHLLLEKCLLDIFVLLVSQFKEDPSAELRESRKLEERLLRIVQYINTNCTDRDLNLNKIAEHFFLNPQYLSRYFKNEVGTSLKKFIDNIRMSKSLTALSTSDNTIMAIAMDFGFPDAKAYYRVFKDAMGMTPNEYRERFHIDTEKKVPRDYFSINSREALSNLFKYLVDPGWTAASRIVAEGPLRTVKIENTDSGLKLTKDFLNLTTFGYAPHGLRSDFNDQLSLVQNEIGFRYIRFHGIFSDDMHVYNESGTGAVHYDFSHTDALFDILLGNRIKPFVELGYMPLDLASRENCIFQWKGNISPPKDIGKWLDLIEAFFRHILNRYGEAEVLSWYFEFWNEPEMENIFWAGSREEFFSFFTQSYKRIKSVNPEIRLGGFGNIFFSENNSWLKNFDTFASSQEVKLDFYSFHVYNLVHPEGDLSRLLLNNLTAEKDISEMSAGLVRDCGVHLGDRDHISITIDRRIKKTSDLPSIENDFWVTEWNANSDSRDLIHDTCFMAAFIVRNVLKNNHKLSGMGFWTFTDIFEEFALEKGLYHGGFGLLTYNGIPKASYNAYLFLSRLGDKVLHQEEGIIATRDSSDGSIIILLYNYVHYNALYERLEYSQISITERYSVFEAAERRNIKLLPDVSPGRYRIVRQRVNRDSGSSFDEWVRMGAPEMLSKDGLEHLKRNSGPSYNTWISEAGDSLELSCELEPHEIQLLTISREY